ncbi:MAG: hypothetical protein ACLQQ4_04950 [Bacteroidia bacterium]
MKISIIYGENEFGGKKGYFAFPPINQIYLYFNIDNGFKRKTEEKHTSFFSPPAATHRQKRIKS